jgi:hypothetical protein
MNRSNLGRCSLMYFFGGWEKISIIVNNYTLMLRGAYLQDTPPFVNVQFKNVLPIIEDGYLFIYLG